MAFAVIGLVAAIAIPSYRSYAERMKVSVAIADISKISLAIQHYEAQNLALPPDLAAVGCDGLLDPWGQHYFYLSFEGLKGKGALRKDKNLVPINSQYDLYSAGADGKTKGPLTATDSQDDVIRANDGGFIGLASDY
jgi:general secretion pathway protein G